MDAVIIDTNVLVIANGTEAAPQTTEECVIRCQARLAQILRGSEKVLLDDKKRIIQEYRNNLNEKGRGFGDRFWQELVRRMWRKGEQEKVIMVHITPLAGNGTDFEEFPNDDASLKNFHKKDRKFVAVVLAYQSDSEQEAPILIANDSGWKEFNTALANHGVHVDSICDNSS